MEMGRGLRRKSSGVRGAGFFRDLGFEGWGGRVQIFSPKLSRV